MNAYLVRIPEERCEAYVGGYEPPEPWWPTGIFVADTPGQARADALAAWTHSIRSGVYEDDWPALRVRLLERDTLAQPVRGELDPARRDDEKRLWGRVHEVLDHDGRPCDCPEGDE